MENQKEKEEDKKIYWCQCADKNKEVAQKIRKGSIPRDTGKICPECGHKIIEEDAI